MLLGIVTPALTMVPGAHAGWEDTATWPDVVAVVQAADRLGFHHVTCSEHVAVPTEAAAVRGGRYWDPLATFGYLAGVTTQINFATYVVVLGYHHPLEIAKRYGTLDVVCGGRLILGVGVGTLREEFALLGVSFDDRGARADEALVALRDAWGKERPSHHGRFYDYDQVVVDPRATRTDVPIWVGGRTPRSLRRAITLGTGWAPFGLRPAEAALMLAHVERPDGFDVALQSKPIDAIDAPDASADALGELLAAGATHVTLRLVHHSPTHYVEQLEAVRGLTP